MEDIQAILPYIGIVIAAALYRIVWERHQRLLRNLPVDSLP